MSNCFVPNCEAAFAEHRFTFTVSAPLWGETEVEIAACCDHFDRLVKESIDVTVAGVERA